MFCNNLCSWFSKNIVFSLSAREIISPIKLSWQINFSSWFLFSFYHFSLFWTWKNTMLITYIWFWPRALNRVLLQDVVGRGAFGAVWVHQIENREIGQWTLNISRVSLLLFVLLIHALILGVVMKIFYLGRGGGGEGGVPSSSLKVTRGKNKEEEAGGGGWD